MEQLSRRADDGYGPYVDLQYQLFYPKRQRVCSIATLPADAPQTLGTATCRREGVRREMRALFAEKSKIKADEIAAHQAWLLGQHLGPRDGELRLTDVKEMFLQMRDQT